MAHSQSFAETKFSQRHEAAHVLSSGELSIEVMDPNDAARYNRGVRFSPVANVLRAVEKGKDFLFSPVEHDPLTDNAGLAMEFDLMVPDGPPGFKEAAEGEGFLKVGVGVLRKKGAEYSFFAQHEIVELAKTSVEWKSDRAIFHQTSGGVNGYAYALDAEVRVEKNEVIVDCRLKNAGTKAFQTEQYTHNFLLFDGRTIGPGYELKFPGDFDAEKLAPSLERRGDALIFAAEIPEKGAVNAKVLPKDPSARGRETVISDSSAGMSVALSVSEPVDHVAVHARPFYLCPEQFIEISLAPGETAEWTRTYRFELN